MIISESVEINAPLSVVWKTFAQMENWDEWNTACRQCCILSGDENLSADDPTRFRDQPKTGERGQALSAPGFTYDSDPVASSDRHREFTNGVRRRATFLRETYREPSELDHGRCRKCCRVTADPAAANSVVLSGGRPQE